MLCSVFILFSVIFGADCTVNDIKISYGPCLNNARDIVFYVKNNTCTIPTNFHIPSPLRGKECNFSCASGYFYDLTKNGSTCTACPAGQEADGFSVIYNNLTANNIAPFTSKCSGTNCKNWTVWGTYLTSGFQDSDIQVNLSLPVDIFQEDGEVLFEYTCPETQYESAEMHFYIDEHRVSNGTYISDVWRSEKVTIPFGHHVLTWEFQTYFFYNPSEIGARVRNVEIRGTKYLVTSCRNCTNGSTSAQGSQCTPCPFNTVPGNGICVACNDTQYAYPGDTTCKTRSACKDIDYYEEYGPCIDNQRTVTKKLYNSVLCYQSSIPSSTTAPCPTCDPGHYKKSGTCAPCEDGTYRNGSMSDDSCLVCPAGTFASKRSNNMRPSIINNTWYKTGCVSDDKDFNNCATSGWIEEEKVITPGSHFGPVTVWLNRTLNTTEFGTLFFSYTTKLLGDSYFKFYSSDWDYFMANSSQNGQKHNFTAYFYGITTFSWLFIKTCHNNGSTNSTCPRSADTTLIDTVEIDELSYSTESVGGGTECSVCAAGTYNPQEKAAVCEVCAAGTYSQENATECVTCPEGQISAFPLSSACEPCLNNTVPNADHTLCVFNACGFEHNETFAFSLAALQTDDAMINATIPNNESRLVYVDVCTQAHSNNTCRDWYEEDPEGGEASYACAVVMDPTYYYSYTIGTQAEMNFLEVKDSNNTLLRYGVNLTYTHGDYYYCSAWSDTNPDPPRLSMEIDFICVPESGVGEPLPSTPFEDSSCRFHYDWTTEYACRVCTANDYESLAGACTKGKKNITWVLKKGSTVCTHGYTPNPVWQISSCPNPFVKLAPGIIGGIVGGFLLILAIAIFFIIFYIRKNRNLRYQLYQKQNFGLVNRDEESGDREVEEDAPASSTSMFGPTGQAEQYKGVDFGGTSTSSDSTF